MYRLKTILGGRLKSREFKNQKAEATDRSNPHGSDFKQDDCAGHVRLLYEINRFQQRQPTVIFHLIYATTPN